MLTTRVSILVGLIAFCAVIVYRQKPELVKRFCDSIPWCSHLENVLLSVGNGPVEPQEKLFSIEELSKYNGEKDSPGLYLSILGKVFDVGKGKKHYGPGGSYNAFAGRDASRSFVTGDFSDTGLTDDVSGLSPQDLKSIEQWSQFYVKDYIFKGKLVGRFYNTAGERTDYYNEVVSLIRQAEKEIEANTAEKIKYPPCNVEWTLEEGSKVWCSERSGGIERDWVGVPRKLYEPGSDSHRCACVKYTADMKKKQNEKRRGNFEEYEGCPPDSDSCYIKI